MFGLLCGALLAYQSSAPHAAPPGPDESACGDYRIEWNDNPANWSPIAGCVDEAGAVTWWPDRQTFSPPPHRRDDGPEGDRWVVAKVNGRAVTMWGWKAGGRSGWRLEDQRTHVLPGGPTGDLRPTEPASKPIKSGVVLPSGFEPKQDPRTGALLMGVDAKGLAKDGEQVRASDPQTKAEGEDVRKFYEMGPDSTTKAVVRNLPPIISPTAWASIFGYDLPTALIRIGGVGLLGGAAFLVHRRISGAP